MLFIFFVKIVFIFQIIFMCLLWFVPPTKFMGHGPPMIRGIFFSRFYLNVQQLKSTFSIPLLDLGASDER